MAISKVKVGLIGLGNIGTAHAENLSKMDNVDLVGVCDIVKDKADAFATQYGSTAYYNYHDLLHDSGVEAIIVAVPHYDHVSITVDAFAKNIHVLCEKPLAVHVNDAKKMISAFESAKAKNPNLLFGVMFQERTYPYYRKLKDLLDHGDLGQLTRVTWINTTWFRTQAYYDSGTWRATWAGEGGGILTNQCPHNLDMYQWLFGLPVRISGHAHIGKYHNIEVEDEVSAYFEHDNGMVGHFIVTTGESPGTNRLEIAGENGKLVYEDSKIVFYRNRESMLTFLAESLEGFAHVENWYTEIPVKTDETVGHFMVAKRFMDAILIGSQELTAHGPEGLNGLILANGIMLSSFTHKTVEVPFDGDDYENILKDLVKNSKFIKPIRQDIVTHMNKSFNV